MRRFAPEMANSLCQEEPVPGAGDDFSEYGPDNHGSLLSFWENPANYDLIVNAEPLDFLITAPDLRSEDAYSHLPDLEPLEINQIDIHPKESKSLDTIRQTCSSEARQKILPRARFVPTSGRSGTNNTSIKQNQDQVDKQNPDQNGKRDQVRENKNDWDQEGIVELVDDNELTEFPAHGVGKLFWCLKKNEKKGKIVNYCACWSTAFYVGKEKIMTVAHVFYDVEKLRQIYKEMDLVVLGGVFVPAMIDSHDHRGKNFGYYAITKPRLCSKYEYKEEPLMSEICYDFAIVPICTVGRSKCQLSLLNELELKVPQTEKFNVKFIVYGYGRKKSEDVGNKMTKVTASVIPKDILIENPVRPYLIPIRAKILQGMSGGPWMQLQDGNLVAAGIQSGTSSKQTFNSIGYGPVSVSPNFEEQEVRSALKKLYS